MNGVSDRKLQFLERNLPGLKIAEDGTVPVLFQGFVRNKDLSGHSCGAEQLPVFVLHIEKEPADQIRRNGKVQLFQSGLGLPAGELKDKLKSQRGSLPADHGVAKGFQILPERAASAGLLQYFSGVRIKEILSKSSVNGKGVEGGDGNLRRFEVVEGISHQQSVHEIFDISDFQRDHKKSPLPVYGCIIKHREKKEQSFSKKSFQTQCDVLRCMWYLKPHIIEKRTI